MPRKGFKSATIHEDLYYEINKRIHPAPGTPRSVSNYVELAIKEKLERDQVSDRTQCNAGQPTVGEKEDSKT